jgi:hypothetical protein
VLRVLGELTGLSSRDPLPECLQRRPRRALGVGPRDGRLLDRVMKRS